MSQPIALSEKNNIWKVIAASSVGTLIEWYDFYIFGSLAPIIALLAGILILAQPKLLNYIVAIYLIVIGLLGLFGGSLNL